MKLYRVSFSDGDNKEVAKWVGTQADVSKTKNEFMDAHGVKRKQISTEEIDVPTKKDELIEWLNKRSV